MDNIAAKVYEALVELIKTIEDIKDQKFETKKARALEEKLLSPFMNRLSTSVVNYIGLLMNFPGEENVLQIERGNTSNCYFMETLDINPKVADNLLTAYFVRMQYFESSGGILGVKKGYIGLLVSFFSHVFQHTYLQTFLPSDSKQPDTSEETKMKKEKTKQDLLGVLSQIDIYQKLRSHAKQLQIANSKLEYNIHSLLTCIFIEAGLAECE